MGFQVVGEAANSTETIEMYRKLRPDVLLLDLRMPHKGGIEAVRAIRGEFPQARVLVVTSYQTEEEVLQVLKAGALGYILKDLDGSMLMQAIQAVCAGKTVDFAGAGAATGGRCRAPAADGAGAGGAASAGARTDESGDRQRLSYFREHGEEPREPPAGEAGGSGSDRGGELLSGAGDRAGGRPVAVRGSAEGRQAGGSRRPGGRATPQSLRKFAGWA